ncbi:MarR family transcriptional regulator [Salipiger sp. IMCC34102]|uniref:MarR family winged helix-turn-helix transcriptional regulator n=1 Tax=Salipiger sp. IMCC34102 TaxID=2510647 RepID=UPI00101CF6A9|nr:MarR family transcriptional regulator [Salipiger sp. IMCC34102]RYH04183.1 MarR family transcriptional regulator [Salipiger sp. IMCC34102]
MSETSQHLAVALFSELLAVDQLARIALDRVLPKGMELSHFSVLNHLAHTQSERSPTQLAQTFHLTRGAMTNTLNRLEWAGYIHVRPDWDDARKKMVSISPSGVQARDAAVAAISPLVSDVAQKVGEDKVRAALPLLRELRLKLSD